MMTEEEVQRSRVEEIAFLQVKDRSEQKLQKPGKR